MTSLKSTAIQLPLPIESATVEIPLTQGYVTVVDAVDADLAHHTWSVQPNGDGNFYAIRRVRYRAVLLHRIVLARILGRELLRGEYVDHVNGLGTDNQRNNLRLATPSQNQWNRRQSKNNTSGYKGVTKKRGKWTARIYFADKCHHLGVFDTPELAHEAYRKAAVELFGEFARPE